MATLGDHVSRIETWNPASSSDTEFDYVDLSSVDQSTKRITAATRTHPDDAPSRARQLLRKGDVVVSTVRPNLNAVAQVSARFDGATGSTGFTVLRPKPSLDGRYLFHWVQSPQFVADMVRKATGASYPAVSDRIVKESEIPLPPIEKQRRIAAILDQADALQASRRGTIAHLNDLTQSIFVDMFGTHSAEVPLVEMIEEFRYGTSNKSGPQGSPTLRIPNVIGGEINVSDLKTVQVTESEFQRLVLQTGDLLFVRTNGNPDNVGRNAVFRPEVVSRSGHAPSGFIYASYLIRARPKSTVEPVFVNAFLSTSGGRRQLRAKSKTSAGQYNINIEGLGSLLVPDVPLDAQREFAARVGRVSKERLRHATALDQAAALFRSLQARAFSGRL